MTSAKGENSFPDDAGRKTANTGITTLLSLQASAPLKHTKTQHETQACVVSKRKLTRRTRLFKLTLNKWNIPETGSPVRHFPNMVHPVEGAGRARKGPVRNGDMTLRKTTNTETVV